MGEIKHTIDQQMQHQIVAAHPKTRIGNYLLPITAATKYIKMKPTKLNAVDNF